MSRYKINIEYDKLKALSDEELRGKTIFFKNEIKNFSIQ